MTPSEIARRRLERQQVVSSTAPDATSVVARLGAIQAQDYASSLWAVGVRLPGTTEVGIESAIAERRIVRTWMMRGTIHLVAAADVRGMLDLVAPRNIAASAGRVRQLGLDERTFAASRKVVVGALGGDRQLTRGDLMALLEGAGISTAGQRGYHILWRLAQEGILCFGARAGKQPTFALFDDWVPTGSPVERDEMLSELARRYFASRGPASLADFAWWSGATLAEARAGLDGVRGGLECLRTGGTELWWAPDLGVPAPARSQACLLPAFDEFILGYRDRSAQLDPRYAMRVVPGGNGVFQPVIVVNGRVAGTWKRTFARKAVAVTAIPFEPSNRIALRAFERAAAAFGRFVALPVITSSS